MQRWTSATSLLICALLLIGQFSPESLEVIIGTILGVGFLAIYIAIPLMIASLPVLAFLSMVKWLRQ
jgi:amino acid permease